MRFQTWLVFGVVVIGALASSSVAWADGLALFARPSALFEDAITALKRGDLKEADALFERLLENEPTEFGAALGRAQVALSQQRMTDADRTVSEVLAKAPHLPEAHNMKGVVLMLQDRNDDARKEFTRALELRPKYFTPRVYLAAISRASGQYKEAAAAYKDLVGVAPRLPIGYVGQAEAEMMMGNEREAFAILEAWKAASKDKLFPAQVLASLYLFRREPQKAVQELQAALSRQPNDSRTLTVLGNAYVVSGDMRQARMHYEAALASDSRNIDAALRLGDLRIKAGEPDRAIEAFRIVLKIAPTHPYACNNLAWLLADRGQNLSEALTLALQATKGDPKYVDAQDTLGWVRFLRGEYQAAVSVLTKAKSLAPDRSDVAAHLGLAYAKLGRRELALAELKRALARPEGLPNRAELERTVSQLSVGARR
jgi:tetratricopeptide (TPR) repeat protein